MELDTTLGPAASQDRAAAHALFPGDSELARRCRAFDWAATSLGPPDGWPPALRTVVRTCLESPFPMNLWCGRDLVLVYNDAYRRVLGAKHPRALGQPGLDVWAEIRADVEPMFAGIRAGGPPVYAEDARFVMARADDGAGAGADAWFTFGLSPVRDDAGEIVAFFNPATETTGQVLARRETDAARGAAERAESRLREVLEQAPVAVCVLRDADHRYELVNPRYQRFFPGRRLEGLPIRTALPELAGQGVYELLDRVRATGEAFTASEYAIQIDRAGRGVLEQGVFNFVYQPVRDAAGVVEAIVVVAVDVTELVQARRAAEEANAAKAQFLAMMSHELRTPLNAIGGYTQLLALGVHGPVTPAQADALDRVEASQRHLLGLIDGVLNYAKLEAGRVNYHPVDVDLSAAVIEVAALVGAQAAAAGHTVDVVPCPELAARADPDKLRQVLLNLLSNAIKFTAPGGRLTITCGAGAAGHVRVDVADTGRGIAADQLERVFEPFVQVGRSYTSTDAGTGLGLAISRDLARGMGGDLTAVSTPGVGSTFTLTLPTADPTPPGPAAGGR